jgi:serine/threonine-protein kinase
MAMLDPAPTRTPRRAMLPGGLEDRYRSLFVIGRGGMGSVEVAIEQGPSQRIVALKRLLPESARDPRHKAMFLREARLAAVLTHPNVVRAFAFGEIHDELFLALEYVEGQPLSRVVETLRESGRCLNTDLAAYILASVCDGLHAAHELRDVDGNLLNVVHRDVSPHNVMIAYDGRVKLLDFGVAKFDVAGNETRTGEVKGKMAYMSPEQALGERLDRRSDLFSMGAVLFECLTGRPMWGSGTDVDVMRKLALEQPPRLGDATSEASAPLAALHSRLVSRDPDERPATARHVADELRHLAPLSQREDTETVLRSLMAGLFGEEAALRRAQLSDALSEAAPSEVEALRRSLEPGAGLHAPIRAEPVIVLAPRNRTGKRARVALTSGIGFVAVAVAALFGARSRRPPVAVDRPSAGDMGEARDHVATAAAPTPTVLAPPTIAPTSNPTTPTGAKPSSGAGGSPTANARLAAESATAATVPHPTPPTSSGSLPAPTRKLASPALIRHPDVDPTPF